jgi:hypothetical protein
MTLIVKEFSVPASDLGLLRQSYCLSPIGSASDVDCFDSYPSESESNSDIVAQLRQEIASLREQLIEQQDRLLVLETCLKSTVPEACSRRENPRVVETSIPVPRIRPPSVCQDNQKSSTTLPEIAVSTSSRYHRVYFRMKVADFQYHKLRVKLLLSSCDVMKLVKKFSIFADVVELYVEDKDLSLLRDCLLSKNVQLLERFRLCAFGSDRSKSVARRKGLMTRLANLLATTDEPSLREAICRDVPGHWVPSIHQEEEAIRQKLQRFVKWRRSKRKFKPVTLEDFLGPSSSGSDKVSGVRKDIEKVNLQDPVGSVVLNSNPVQDIVDIVGSVNQTKLAPDPVPVSNLGCSVVTPRRTLVGALLERLHNS